MQRDEETAHVSSRSSFPEHANCLVCGKCLLQWRKEPTRGLREAACIPGPASPDQHPWTSIPGKMLGRAKQGLEGELICSIVFTVLLKISHIGPANKQAAPTTSAFITVDSIMHIFLIFCLCISYKLY